MAKVGLSKPYYAVYSEGSGTPSYSAGAVMGKATEANIEIDTADNNNLYGDNGIAETDVQFAGGTLTLSTTDLFAGGKRGDFGDYADHCFRNHRGNRRGCKGIGI